MEPKHLVSIRQFEGPLDQYAELIRHAFIANPPGLEQLRRFLSDEQTMRQSGMEAKHEQWVLATLNFLTGMDIPVWNHDERGNRLKNDKEIPERLQLLKAKFAELTRESARYYKQWREEAGTAARLKDQVDSCYLVLKEIASTLSTTLPEPLKDKMAAAFPELVEYFATPPAAPETPLEAPPPDPSGS